MCASSCRVIVSIVALRDKTGALWLIHGLACLVFRFQNLDVERPPEVAVAAALAAR
jgi:hypothetical protein